MKYAGSTASAYDRLWRTAGEKEYGSRRMPVRGRTSTSPIARATSSCSRSSATLTPSSLLTSLSEGSCAGSEVGPLAAKPLAAPLPVPALGLLAALSAEASAALAGV